MSNESRTGLPAECTLLAIYAPQEASITVGKMIILDTKTLKNIHDIIKNNDHETVEFIRSEAVKELRRLKISEVNSRLNAYERRDIAINIEIITRAEVKLNGN